MNKTKLYLGIIILLASIVRLYKLGSNPPSLYWDEVSLGYNAYSILTTGRDEHGEWFPISRFIAFGDYKPPGYIYAAVPSLAFFGRNEFAVRFPSALAGIVSVLVTFFLVKELFTRENYGRQVGLLSAFLLAISPWHIHLSRGAFEANLAMFFNLFAVTLFIYGTRKNWLLSFSVVFFVLSFYTFNANRIIAPLLLFFLSVFYFKKILRAKWWSLVAVFLGIALIFPTLSYLGTRESRLRFQEVSIFTNLEPLRQSNDRIARDGNTFVSRVIHNRRFVYAREFLIHYMDHFKGEFLFIKGDRNPRLSVQEIGEMYLIEFPFLIIGLYMLMVRRDIVSAVFFAWFLIVPIPAGLSRETPHALRTVSILPLLQIAVGLGLWRFYSWLANRNKKVFISLYSFLLFLSVFYYLHNYYVHYPTIWSGEWQYGYKEMVAKVTKIEKNYDTVVVTKALGRPYIYFLFYQPVAPSVYWQTRRADRDWAGLWEVYGMGKYHFDLADIPKLVGKKLIVAKPSEMPKEAKILDTIKQLDGEIVFEIGEL